MKFLSPAETVDFLIENKCSMSRFGDGENGILTKDKGVPTMQKFDKKLKSKLQKVWNEPLENLLLCVHNIGTYKYVLENRKGEIGNSFCTRPTSIGAASDTYFNKFKELWDNREIVIVNHFPAIICSPMFKNAKDISFLSIPMQHCFKEYKRIVSDCRKEFGKNKLFLLSCGMTGAVLSYTLVKNGEYALDIGKLIFEYGKFSGESEKTLINYISQDKLAQKHKDWRKKNVGIHKR